MVHLVVVYRHRGVIGEVGLIKHGEHGVSWLDGGGGGGSTGGGRKGGGRGGGRGGGGGEGGVEREGREGEGGEKKEQRVKIPPIARNGALMPLTSSSLIPANPEDGVSVFLLHTFKTC